MKRLLVVSVLILVIALAYLRLVSNKKPDNLNTGSSVEGSSLLNESYVDSRLGYSLQLPKNYKTEDNGEYSKLIRPDVDVLGVGPANFVYISVVTPELREKNTGEVYNYNSDQYLKLKGLQQTGQNVNLANGDVHELGTWFTYTFVGTEEIDGHYFLNYQNNKPWEFPEGTMENRYIYDTGDTIYIIGYYTGGDDLATETVIDPRLAYSIVKSLKLLNK